MAAIAEIISGVIQGVGNTISSGIDKADEKYTRRVLQGSAIRNQGSLKRNLPIVMVGVVLLIITGLAIFKK